ncbi:hypothetical protein AVEN_261077-1 [Araneus ventricosus]|uniref:Uncharacterized protein n=1 Tax=Araneus ventricosus TaxID=182803 RepID=A0A4Y2L2B8_ARAVE|nr:hypothetical protein AVEN_261077-1 [Araneus ventricosus]
MPISYLFLPPSPLLSEIPLNYPPLPEIPFVSRTICLSIGYILSDSEALALPKCRTFIYTMEPTFKISHSDAFEGFSKGLIWLEQQTVSDSTDLMLLKQLRGRAAKRRQYVI